MKKILIPVILVFILGSSVAGLSDDPFAISSSEFTYFGFTDVVGTVPTGSIIVYGRPWKYQKHIYTSDADWYYNELPRGKRRIGPNVYSSLNHAQVQNLISSTFEEALDQLTWEEYLRRDDTLIEVTANGNMIYVMNDDVLHLIDFPANVVMTIDYSSGLRCSELEGDPDLYDLPAGETAVLRCIYGVLLGPGSSRIRLMKDPEIIKTGVLQALNSVSPFEHARLDMSMAQYLNPPEIWLHDMSYGNSLGDQNSFNLETTFDYGVRGLNEIGFGEHRVRRDFSSEKPQRMPGEQLRARSAILSSIERILSSKGQKWLLEVSGWGEPILIRNLSNIYMREEKQ